MLAGGCSLPPNHLAPPRGEKVSIPSTGSREGCPLTVFQRGRTAISLDIVLHSISVIRSFCKCSHIIFFTRKANLNEFFQKIWTTGKLWSRQSSRLQFPLLQDLKSTNKLKDNYRNTEILIAHFTVIKFREIQALASLLNLQMFKPSSFYLKQFFVLFSLKNQFDSPILITHSFHFKIRPTLRVIAFRLDGFATSF